MAQFLRYFSANVFLYLAWALLWGTPSIAGLGVFSRDDGPPLVAGFWIVVVAVLFFSYLLFIQLVLYLAVLYRIHRRRLVAALLSPLAIGAMFVFAQGPAETAVVLLAGISYAASVWFPQGPKAWWERRPRLIAVAAAAWLAATLAVGVFQSLSAGVRTDVEVTIRDGGRTARYRLACDYDRAGRVRGQVPSVRAHPGGDSACEALDEAARSLEDGPPYLQRGCPEGSRTARFRGRVRGRPFDERITAAECMETAFADGETSVLVPPI